ncbi:carbohydrate ABC transporter permease [Cohnella faecalis]|uniref:Carbohydrate ABC transporter permease n=1 Tax=Cohnella faecalis TaxID=2315694 RepID=A0A398CGI4_9BACL|nr:carbohydrate ABC transporter permease [Cohnella faecalis]RIE00189.1 carbohydrate ABC transporter permease [Cohnella faecalis]
MKAKKRNELIVKIGIHATLILFAIIVLIPFYWLIVNSLKSTGDFYSLSKSLFPTRPTLDSYRELFNETLYMMWFKNSFIVSVLAVALGLLICTASGFAFASYNFKFKNIIFWTVLGTVAIPEIVTIIPVFNIMVNVGLIDKYASLILPYAVSMFGIFLIKQFIETSLPNEVLESARIDGLNEYGIYFRIVLPLIKPGIGVLAIFLWLNSWSSYFWPLIMIRSTEMMTLPLGLATLYANPYDLKYGVLMAGNLIATVPIIFIFLAAQKQFIEGLTVGAVKG